MHRSSPRTTDRKIDPAHFLSFAGGEQVIVPAGVAVDACEAVMGIAALQEALDRALFHRAAESTRFAKLLP